MSYVFTKEAVLSLPANNTLKKTGLQRNSSKLKETGKKAVARFI